jgi:hypothetical protein
VLLAVRRGLSGLLLAALLFSPLSSRAAAAGALPIADRGELDPRVLLFTLAIASGAASCSGSRRAHRDALGARAGAQGRVVRAGRAGSRVQPARRRSWSRRWRLSVLLLVAAGLFLRNLREIQSVDPASTPSGCSRGSCP